VLRVLRTESDDALTADGPPLGAECAGRITAVGRRVELAIGDEILALATGSLASHVVADARFVVPRPAFLAAEEAATIPVAFLTADYALNVLARVGRGDRVLIHAAAGGVGLAAVQFARRAGAEVYATASEGKWPVLHRLGVAHVFSSRTLEFADQVMARTNGEGVDIVLNSLAGEFIPRSISVLRQGGRFVEIGRTGIWSRSQAAELAPHVSFLPLDLNAIAAADPVGLRRRWTSILDAIRAGSLQALPRRVFPFERVAEAFRSMSHGRHVGKIVVARPPASTTFRIAKPGSYLITGGLSGLGLITARWLAERGAERLVLVQRSHPSDASNAAIAELERTGARVLVKPGDVSDRSFVRGLIDDIEQSGPPLQGVVHSAGIVDDGVLMQLTAERFAAVMAAKVAGSWNLHRETERLKLDFFVLFSSVASLLGSSGQANHAAANAFEDALAHYRRSRGLTALSVNWGGWSESGRATELDSRFVRRWSALGMGTIASRDGLRSLERALSEGRTQLGVFPMDWERYVRQLPGAATAPYLSNLMAELSPGRSGVPTRTDPGPASRAFADRLMSVPADERCKLLSDHVREHVARVLGAESSEAIPVLRGFQEMGMDSLTTLELRNRLQGSLGRPLPSTLAFDYPNVAALATFLLRDLGLEQAAGTEGRPRASTSGTKLEIDEWLAHVESLTDAETQAALRGEAEP
jgi:NADPH:quinone reductase-like Zn-dependent oxidoreductase/acyl carrier protein